MPKNFESKVMTAQTNLLLECLICRPNVFEFSRDNKFCIKDYSIDLKIKTNPVTFRTAPVLFCINPVLFMTNRVIFRTTKSKW